MENKEYNKAFYEEYATYLGLKNISQLAVVWEVPTGFLQYAYTRGKLVDLNKLKEAERYKLISYLARTRGDCYGL